VSPATSFESYKGRYYVWSPTGETFPSVTTILGKVMPPYLANYAAGKVADYTIANSDLVFNLLNRGDSDGARRLLIGAANANTNAAMARGTAVHKAIEHYAKGLPLPPVKPEYQPWVRQAIRFLEETDAAFHLSELEMTVYSRKYGYAGSLDGITEIDGSRILYDVKTAEEGKTPYPDVALQLSAYRYSDFYGVDGKEVPMPRVDSTAVLHLTPSRWQFVPATTDEPVFQVFRALAFVYTRWIEGVSKQVLGIPRLSTAVAA
jgi:hypothetical protein